ncbi:hypothetical protein GBAR_LOCUS17871, partial [Geodia barretti]
GLWASSVVPCSRRGPSQELNPILKTNKSARDSLAMALHNQQWIHLGDELSPKELMKAVLSRIEGDAREYNVFMHILRNTVGLESIAIRIQQTHGKSLASILINDYCREENYLCWHCLHMTHHVANNGSQQLIH